jgi:hypothetical protein
MTHSGNGSVNFKCYENVNNRVLAGCNAQLDSGGFSGKSDAKWDNTLQAPAYTNKDGEKVISYSYWYAVRKCAKEHMYMASRCTGTNRGITKVIEDGEEYVEFEARQDFEYYLPDGNFRLNQRVELPKGVKFEDNKLFGKFENEGVYHLDFIQMDDDENAIGAFKLIVTATTGDERPEPVEPKKKVGCGGDIASVGAIASLVALAGVGLILVSLRKRKEA